MAQIVQNDGVSAGELMFRSTAAWAEKDEWKSTMQDAYQFAMPDRNPYTGNRKGPKKRSNLYDSTAMNAVIRGAGRMVMDLTPYDQDWIEIKTGPMFPEDKKEVVNKILEYVTKLCMVQLHSGQFISAIFEFFLDLLTAGFAAMLVLENPKDNIHPVIFKTVSQADVTIELGPNGDVEGVFRNPVEKARMIKRIWNDVKSIPKELQDKIDDTKKDHEIELIEATYFMPDNKNEPWKYQILYKSDENNDPVCIVDRDYTTNPWITTRWMKIPGSTYGPGPVMLALPDIKTANKLVEMILKNAAFAVSGMYTVVDDGVVNPATIQFRPGGLIPVKKNGGPSGPSIQSLEAGRGFDLGQIVLQDIRTSIRKTLIDNGLPPESAGIRSATEIVERMRELAQDLGGAFGRLMSELIVPLTRRVVDILFKRGLIPVKFNIDQFAVKVQVNSPLARTQQMQDVQKVVQWLELCTAIAGPEAALAAGKIEEILPWIAERLGVPQELIRDKAQLNELFSKLVEGAVNQNQPVEARPQGVLPQQKAA